MTVRNVRLASESHCQLPIDRANHGHTPRKRFHLWSPHITVELADLGIKVNHKRVGTLMRAAEIKGVSHRRGFVTTTHRNKCDRPAADLMQRHFKVTSINQLWVANMAYIPTWAGFLYLAVVIDVFSRKVVGWSFGENMTASLVISA